MYDARICIRTIICTEKNKKGKIAPRYDEPDRWYIHTPIDCSN